MAKKARRKTTRTKKKSKVKKRAGARKKRVPKKRAVSRKPARKVLKAPVETPELPAEPIGRVTHYFPKAQATAVMIEREGIRAGDLLYFKGHTTRFKQRVESLQINHQPVSEGSPGDEVGIRVRARCRDHDLVFKL